MDTLASLLPLNPRPSKQQQQAKQGVGVWGGGGDALLVVELTFDPIKAVKKRSLKN